MKAYVIMPYGNAEPELKKEFDKVFRFLIRTAVETYDPQIELIRQDYTGEGGYIISNIIENLSSCDLVIADISMLNWNVAYELGIRHTFSKSHTILLCNDKTVLPFDVQHLNVILYPRDTWMDDIDAVSDRIVQSIKNSMKTNHCDSPVHLKFPALPDSLTDVLGGENAAEQSRIAELTAENQLLTKEVEGLRQKLENAGLDANTSDNKTKGLMQLFVTAAQNRDLVSDTAVNRLRELEKEKDYEEFARFLAKVLENGYLDETDCKNVYLICRRLGIPDITKQYIQIAVTFYPESEELQGYLAYEYSNDYREKDRAQTIANDMLGVKRVNGKFELVPKVRSRRMLASFFDVYLHLKKYEEIIEIGKLLHSSTPSYRSMILRNISNAALKLENIGLAHAAVSRAIHQEPTDDLNYHSLYLYYSNRHDNNAAYEALENALNCDRTDTDYYHLLAGRICDYLIARTDSGQIESISYKDKHRYVLPFILHAVRIENSFIKQAVQFLKNNSLEAYIPIVVETCEKGTFDDSVFEKFDMDIVERCFKDEATMQAYVQALPDDLEMYL